MTLKNVALVKAGTWSASTGVTTITRDDLASMAVAHSDHLVDRPPIKIGHDDDNVFNAALGDGEPAYGWLENVSVGDGSEHRPDRDTLYADVVGMPTKLEAVAPKAYRRRSVEIAWGVKAASGKAYRAVLTGLALLGVKPPAVKGLDDVLALYSGLGSADSVSAIEIVDGLDAEQTAAFSAVVSALAVLDTVHLPPRSDEGQHGDTDNEQQPATSGSQEGKPMTTINKADVDKALADAGEADVTDLLKKLIEPEGKSGDEGKEPEGGKPATGAEPAATDADDTVTLSKETFAQLSAGAEAGITAAKAIDAQRRDQIIRTALSEGRISPAEQKTFREQLDTNEAGTTALLSALTPRFATGQVGDALPASTSSELAAGEQAEWDVFHNETFGTTFGADA